MKLEHLTILIKPASSKCNMKCKYCFYFNEITQREIADYGLMPIGVAEAIINYCFQATTNNATINFAFQGGEPTLIGIDFYYHFINYALKYKQDRSLEFSIQTNGTTLNSKWLNLFKQYNFLVGISIDGFSSNHNNARILNNYNPTYHLIMKSLKQLQNYQIRFNVLSVITNNLSKQPKKYFQWLLNHKIEYVQIIPCLPTNLCQQDIYKVSPTNLGNFWITLFDLWYEKLIRNNHYIRIGWFENILLILNGQYPTQCGMMGNCSFQNVVESNGNIYPCDFYCQDQYLLGNVLNDSLSNIARKTILSNFLKPNPLPNICSKCCYLNYCKGNCKHMRSNYIENDYCAYQHLLNARLFLFKKALIHIIERNLG